jgi:hypothetical protein
VADFDVDYATSAALLDVSNFDAAPIQRMPAIMDFNFLPDMGRMNGKFRRVATIGYSSPASAAVTPLQRFLA